MITITDTDNKPLSSLRLRPAQQATIRLSTDDLMPMIANLQATRADFLLKPLTGEAESVSRGNGQELLDDGLVEALLGGVWVPLNEAREVGIIGYGEPIDVTLRVKNVGQAVGEVAFGLAAICLSFSKLMMVASPFLRVTGHDNVFYQFDKNGWAEFPPVGEKIVLPEMPDVFFYSKYNFLTNYNGITEYGEALKAGQTILAQGLTEVPEGYIATLLTDGIRVSRGENELPIASVEDDLIMTAVEASFILRAFEDDIYTHKMDLEREENIIDRLAIGYEEGEWFVHLISIEDGEVVHTEEMERVAGTAETVPLRWFIEDEEVHFYIFKKEN